METEKAEAKIDTEAAGKAEAGQKEESGQEADGGAQERIQQLTKEVEEQKQANSLLQENMALLQANAPQPGQQPAEEKVDIYKQAGLDPNDPEDIPNQGQLKNILTHHMGQISGKINQLAFMAEHPDYSEIVGSAEQIRLGQMAEPLKEAIRKNPALIATIQASAQPQLAAYSIAKLHQKNKDQGKSTTKTEAEQVIDNAVANANRVKSASNTKGGTALTGDSRYEAMTDAEFVEIAKANGANF